MNELGKIVGKTKVYRIRSQQIIKPISFPPINEWAERRRREWNGHVARKDAKISRDNIPAARRFPRFPKRK
jgi:hypothetical protein